jgi:Zn finger protein HypA/HybF involved in hydrogenase expression
MDEEVERIKAMVNQALAEARAQGAERITALHLTMFDHSEEALTMVQKTLADVSAGTPAEGARLVTRYAPSRYICWNCCGLRFESEERDAVCPNCGGVSFVLPPEITFALDRVEFSD